MSENGKNKNQPKRPDHLGGGTGGGSIDMEKIEKRNQSGDKAGVSKEKLEAIKKQYEENHMKK